MMTMYKIRLNLELNPGPDRVYTITSPDIPGLITEGSAPDEITHNVQEALAGLIEVWRDLGMALPPALQELPETANIEMLVAA